MSEHRHEVGRSSLWGKVFAAGYDRLMASSEKAGLIAHREALVPRASGRVIEIGGGTGANLPYYGEAVTELVLTEPEEPMAKRLERNVAARGIPARVTREPAENLSREQDGSFDFAVSTLVLCTVEDQARALGEVHRLLKPGGQLLFMEHVRAGEGQRLGRWQDRFNFIQLRLAHGCNCNRNTVRGIEQAGFTVSELEETTFPKGPPVVRPLVVGVAQRA